jgi:ABC-type glycerol-3-phosphate transport system substrate-binding protein
MKNRLFMVFLSLILAGSLVACNSGETEVSQEPVRTPIPVIDDGLPELDAEILIRSVNPNINLVDDEYPYLETWSDVVYDRFGVDVKVSFFPLYKVMKDTPEQLYIYDHIRVNPQEGLLLHDLSDVDISYNIMKKLIDDKAILPVTEYMKASPYYDVFDSDLLKLLTDESGDIWGIPIDSAHPIYEARGYRKSWLENLSLNVPNTVDEFYEVMRAFTYDDPDGNDVNDTFGHYGPYDFKYSLNDVLKAYGLYNGTTSFMAYNPNTGTIEDSLLSPDAANALNFINQMVDESLIRKTGLSPGVYDSIIPDNCGSILWSYSANDDVVYAPAPMLGTNTVNLVNVTTYGRVYFVLSGTENPESMFNSFVKLFMGDEEAYLMLKYGIPGRHFEVNDTERTITIYDRSLTNENINKIVIGSGMTIDGDLLLDLAGSPDNFAVTDYRVFYNEVPDNPDDYYNQAKKAAIDSYLDSISPYIYKIPTNAALVASEFVDNWAIKVGSENSVYYRDVEQATMGQRIISIEDALQAYRDNMKRLGIQELLDEANLQLGKTTVNGY